MLERDRARFALRARAGRAVAARRRRPRGVDAAAAARRRTRCATRSTRSPTATSSLDYLYACATLFAHLSRIGEELVLWTTAEFGFAKLPENAATGSSMMPQKLNPDVAELTRGKAGTAIGRLTGLLATVKGLPLAYNSRPAGGQAAASSRRAATCAARSAALDGARRRARVRPRPARRRRLRPAPARDRRRRGARRRRRALPRRARAGRRGRCAAGRSSRAGL